MFTGGAGTGRAGRQAEAHMHDTPDAVGNGGNSSNNSETSFLEDIKNLIVGLNNYSYLAIGLLLIIYTIGKIWANKQSFDDSSKKPTDMPVNLHWVNVGVVALISLFVLLSFGYVLNFMGNSRKWGVIFCYVLMLALMIGLIVLEIKQSPLIVDKDRHESRAPYLALLIFGTGMACLRVWESKEWNIIGLVCGLSGLGVVLYLIDDFLLGRDSNVLGLQHVVDNNNEKYRANDQNFTQDYKQYLPLTNNDTKFIELGFMLFSVFYIYNKHNVHLLNLENESLKKEKSHAQRDNIVQSSYKKKIRNIGQKIENVKTFLGVSDERDLNVVMKMLNKKTLLLFVLSLVCAGVYRVGCSVMKWVFSYPRPGAFIMAGCDLKQNSAKCPDGSSGKVEDRCPRCSAYGQLPDDCSNTCAFLTDDVSSKGKVTPDCLCNGNTGDIKDISTIHSCPSIKERKVGFKDLSQYTDEQKRNIRFAFTGSPSVETGSVGFVVLFLVGCLWAFRKGNGIRGVMGLMTVFAIVYGGLIFSYYQFNGNWNNGSSSWLGFASGAAMALVATLGFSSVMLPKVG